MNFLFLLSSSLLSTTCMITQMKESLSLALCKADTCYYSCFNEFLSHSHLFNMFTNPFQIRVKSPLPVQVEVSPGCRETPPREECGQQWKIEQWKIVESKEEERRNVRSITML